MKSCCIGIAILCSIFSQMTSASDSVSSHAVQRAYEKELLASDCLITPHSVVDLSAPMPGLLEAVHVERSDYVEKGQLVASMASGVEHANVQLARKRAQIDADINLNRINLDYDKRQKGRIDALFQKQAVNIQHKDDADRETKLSTWKLQEARDISEIRALELKRAEEQLALKEVRSSISGFVIKRYRQGGEYIEDQPILRIARLDPLFVEAVLPLSLFGKISAGMQAEIYPETSQDKPLLAEVSLVDRMGDAASGTFGLRLTMPNPNYEVPAGLKCKLKFIAGTRTAKNKPAQTREPTQPSSRIAVGKPTIYQRSLGPITDSEQLTALQARLDSLRIKHSKRTEMYDSFNGYLVLGNDTGTDQLMQEKKKKLEAAGISDVSLIGSEQRRRLVLGFFSSKSHAERHQKKLSTAGIGTYVKPQKIRHQRWWIDMELKGTSNPDRGFLAGLNIQNSDIKLVGR
jgi:multidrug efflux pump subunit AcrA (membrane-fusion protein)